MPFVSQGVVGQYLTWIATQQKFTLNPSQNIQQMYEVGFSISGVMPHISIEIRRINVVECGWRVCCFDHIQSITTKDACAFKRRAYSNVNCSFDHCICLALFLSILTDQLLVSIEYILCFESIHTAHARNTSL